MPPRAAGQGNQPSSGPLPVLGRARTTGVAAGSTCEKGVRVDVGVGALEGGVLVAVASGVLVGVLVGGVPVGV